MNHDYTMATNKNEEDNVDMLEVDIVLINRRIDELNNMLEEKKKRRKECLINTLDDRGLSGKYGEVTTKILASLTPEQMNDVFLMKYPTLFDCYQYVTRPFYFSDDPSQTQFESLTIQSVLERSKYEMKRDQIAHIMESKDYCCYCKSIWHLVDRCNEAKGLTCTICLNKGHSSSYCRSHHNKNFKILNTYNKKTSSSSSSSSSSPSSSSSSSSPRSNNNTIIIKMDKNEKKQINDCHQSIKRIETVDKIQSYASVLIK